MPKKLRSGGQGAQNEPRPILAHRPGGDEAALAENRLGGRIGGFGLSLHGGHAGLGQRPAAGGADGLGGIALALKFG